MSQEIQEVSWKDKADYWFSIANELGEDLKDILWMARNYQKGYSMMDIPDPNLVELRKFLLKYKFPGPYDSPTNFRIYANGIDITKHPDSIQAEVIEDVEVKELESGD